MELIIILDSFDPFYILSLIPTLGYFSKPYKTYIKKKNKGKPGKRFYSTPKNSFSYKKEYKLTKKQRESLIGIIIADGFLKKVNHLEILDYISILPFTRSLCKKFIQNMKTFSIYSTYYYNKKKQIREQGFYTKA